MFALKDKSGTTTKPGVLRSSGISLKPQFDLSSTTRFGFFTGYGAVFQMTVEKPITK